MSTATLTRITLEDAKANPALKAQIVEASKVRIYCGQHMAYWRTKAHGYTDDPEQAVIFPGHEAYANSKHCGPEKQVSYEIIP
jgi:hypothetical protein